MLHRIDHVNIVVTDLEAMTAFYRDVLGLRVTKRVTIGGEWIDRVVGLRGVRADVVYLDPPDGPRLELIRYHAPRGDEPPPGLLGRPNTAGLRHLAFAVSDIDALVATLARAGVAFDSGVQIVPDAQVTYAGGARKRLVYFRDPEGNILELCEYKAGQP